MVSKKLQDLWKYLFPSPLFDSVFLVRCMICILTSFSQSFPPMILPEAVETKKPEPGRIFPLISKIKRTRFWNIDDNYHLVHHLLVIKRRNSEIWTIYADLSKTGECQRPVCLNFNTHGTYNDSFLNCLCKRIISNFCCLNFVPGTFWGMLGNETFIHNKHTI